MIVDERIVTFINSLDTKNSELLEKIESEARAADVPIIRREMQSFLKVLLMLKKPVQILEVGTAVGFSALLILVQIKGKIFLPLKPETGQANLIGG